jgi:eukaryotic-like serine/threonine-protein kinase
VTVSNPGESHIGFPSPVFATTHWSVVLTAGQVGSPKSQAALETLCQSYWCLEKEPERRCPTAQNLADELARFLRDEPILARLATAPERLWRWARRKPALGSLIVLLQVVGVTGLTGIVWQWWRAENNAIEARAQRDVAEGRLYAA